MPDVLTPRPGDGEPRGHSVIGAIHCVRPTGGADELREVLDREREDCGALRIVIDLTRRDELGNDEINVIVERVGHSPTDAWRIAARPETARQLGRALRTMQMDHIIDVMY